MRHICFLSYASENADSQLDGFFRDLCKEIAPGTAWSMDDARIAFRDRRNLRLGRTWSSELRQALESSSVLVCLASPAYYVKAFCGKEFYIFQKRIQNYTQDNRNTSPAILPLLWYPHRIHALMGEYVWKDLTLPADYERFGLRGLKFEKPSQYKKALAAIAHSIVEIWQKREPEIELPSGVASEFDEIPNAFGGDDWEEAANAQGWIHGPTVANVIYGAGTRRTGASPKYGEFPRDWKPYLPPVAETVGDLTRSAVHGQSLRYREIPVNDNLEQELKQAQKRKNLVLVVADAASLTHEPNPQLKTFDPLKPEGTALLMPWDNSQEAPWGSEELKQNIDGVFSAKSRTPACFRAPILSVDNLRDTLEKTLVEIRASFTKQEATRKEIVMPRPPPFQEQSDATTATRGTRSN
jgi:FxsC-like protein